MFSAKTSRALVREATCYNDLRVIFDRDMVKIHRDDCQKHSGKCAVPIADCDISGAHCSDHSQQGKMLTKEGTTTQYFVALAKYLKNKQIKSCVLENVTTGKFTEIVWDA